ERSGGNGGGEVDGNGTGAARLDENDRGSAENSAANSKGKGDDCDTGNGSGDKDSVEDPPGAMVSVLCHAKFPERIRSPWLRRRHLLRRNDDGGRDDSIPPKFHTRRPEWGSVEITRAMIDLLEEGLRVGGTCGRRYLATPPGDAEGDDDEGSIPPVDRFVFVSESCLPVTTLAEVELALFGPRPSVDTDGEKTNDDVSRLYDKSWIRARSTPNNGYARQLQWDAVPPSSIPRKYVWKADQWIVLTRSHAAAVAGLPRDHLDGRPLWPAFRRVRASDEIYVPTALAVLGILRRPPGGGEVDDDADRAGNRARESCAGEEVRRRRVTYCDWSVGARNPASFARGDLGEVVAKARGEGCLFARKFGMEATTTRGGTARRGGA
ncbi:hypothetical protein ACHAWF_000533, partial [Thalassiosira exigua]